MSFTTDWLTLRAHADGRARARDLMGRAARASMRRRAVDDPVRILDLGAGTGATVRALAPFVRGPQEWRLVDSDAGLLAAARSSLEAAPPAADLTVETHEADLAATPVPWERPPDLVTASALFDLASRTFVEALAQRLAEDRVPLLALLTYDGRLDLAPSHPHDGAMVAAFNTHQRGEKSFGPALGPDGGAVLADVMTGLGYAVTARDSAWILERPRDEALMRATLAGWAEAARELRPDDPGIERWLADRAEGAERLVVGHCDLLAVPG